MFALIAGLVLLGQPDGIVENCILYKIRELNNEYEVGYNLEVNNGEYFNIHRHIELDVTEIVDWDNYPLLIQHLHVGDRLRMTRSTTPGSFYYKVVLIEVHPRPNVSNFDFSKIQERWVEATLSEEVKPSDIFNVSELDLFKQLNNGHPTEGFEKRQKAFYKIKNLPLPQVQKFIIYGRKFYPKQPEVQLRLNFIEYELHSQIIDFSSFSYWFNKYALR